jgi:GWxTD domain-containing protein
LDEDVAYIITPEEKQTFLRLNSDAERERFIEQFWEVRDVINRNLSNSNNSAENGYRTEHYRRIAFANENFGVGNVAGWKTARGEFYITHGQPDEINHTSTAEVWFYRHSAAFGRNVEIEFPNNGGPKEFSVRGRKP